jgi:hypothetical protein
MPDDLHPPVAPESAPPAPAAPAEPAPAEPAVAPSPASPAGLQPPARHTWRVAIVAGAVIGVLALSLAFAPVRTLAVQMLEVFRVQKIATVAITSDDLDKIGRALENGDPHVSLEELGDMWIDGSPTSGSAEPEGTTLSAAQAGVDFPVRIPSGVDGTRTVLLDPGGSVKFKLHVDKVNELLRYYGATKVFSKSLEGKTFAIKTPPTVYLAYGKDKFEPSAATAKESEGTTPSTTFDPDRDYVFVLQTRGPELVVPSGANPLEIRDVLINLPFLPRSIRDQLAGVSDWQHTLLVPSISGSTRDITVAGHPGVLITVPEGELFAEEGNPDAVPTDPDATPPFPDATPSDPDAEPLEPPVAVMWQQDGVLRAVISTSEKRSLQIAESMVR